MIQHSYVDILSHSDRSNVGFKEKESEDNNGTDNDNGADNDTH